MQLTITINISEAALADAISTGKLDLEAYESLPTFTDAELAAMYASGKVARYWARKYAGRSYNYFNRHWQAMGLDTVTSPKYRQAAYERWLDKRNSTQK